MRGRPPKPTQLKLLTGNPGRRPLNTREPEPALQSASLPAHLRWLPDEAKAEWKRLAPELARLRLLTVLETGLLAMYCEAYALWVQASKIVAKEGFTFTSANGNPRPHPALAVSRAAAETVVKIAAQFGMTPASRTRVAVSPQPDPFDNDF
jgi:P27 family predicted phage terminase small subunit